MCCHRYAPHQARHAAHLIALLNPLRYRQNRPGSRPQALMPRHCNFINNKQRGKLT
jgi:hypothetical protein